MDLTSPTISIPSQIRGEAHLTQVVLDLLYLRFLRSSSTSLTLHYGAFFPSNGGVGCLSLHISKPS